jgi:Tol biopolymer transport system component
MLHRWKRGTQAVGVAMALSGGIAISGQHVVSMTITQNQPDLPALASASLSDDGRFVTFESLARLVHADEDEVIDVYVLEIASGRVELISVATNGLSEGDTSSAPRLSGDGRYVVFESITPRPQPVCVTVYVRDRNAAATRALATAWDNPSRGVCARRPAISADGESNDQGLVAQGDANGTQSDVYVINRRTGHVERISLAIGGTQPTKGASFAPSVSGSGEFVAFTSTACLDGGPSDQPSSPGTAPCKPRVFVRNLATGLTRGLTATDGRRPNGSTHSPALSGDGRTMVFVSTATNLARGDRNVRPDIYSYDLRTGSVELLSRSLRGNAGNGASVRPAISENGRYVAFDSSASDLVSNGSGGSTDRDHNLVNDVFLLDRRTGLTSRLSQEGPGRPWWEPSAGPAMDANARVVVFSSRHATDEGDVNADFDLFILQRPRDALVGLAAGG